MVEAQAYANMGQTIQQIGQVGFQYAERIRKIDEAGKISALEANMNEDAAKFSIELMTREDTANWPTEWKERSGQWLTAAKEQGLSPEGMARFQERFTQWNTQRSIGFETQAATKAIELGRARISNSLNYHAAHENWDAYSNDLTMAREAGILSTPEFERGVMDMNTKRAAADLDAAVESNPGSLVNADEDTIRREYPGSTPEMVRYAKQRAEKQEVRLAADTARKLEDRIYSDTPPTIEQMEQDPEFVALKNGGNAKLAEGLKRELGARYDENIQRMRGTEPYQSMLMGKLAKDIAGLDATDDVAVYKVESLLRQMETGPMKNHLTGELTRRINGEPEDNSAVGLNLRVVDGAFKNGFFAKTKPEEPARVEKLVNEGFVSVANLREAGFNEEQAKAIFDGEDPARQTNGKRLAAMRDLYQNRADKGAIDKLREADPFKAAAVDAIISGESTVAYKSAETQAAEAGAQWKAAGEYAKTKKQLLEWAKANPKKAEDIEAVRGELLRIIGPTRDEDFIESTFEASDLDGMALPARDAPPFEPLDLPWIND